MAKESKQVIIDIHRIIHDKTRKIKPHLSAQYKPTSRWTTPRDKELSGGL